MTESEPVVPIPIPEVFSGDMTEFSPAELNETISISDHSLSSSLLELAVIVDSIYTPVLCLFGVFGNCLSILVFFSRSPSARGGLSSSVYLSALAISDTGFLINLFILWLNNMGMDLLTNAVMCPTVMYLGQVTGFLSVWFIVAFTIERFVAVSFPLSPNVRGPGTRARRITAGLTVFAIIAFSYVCIIAQVVEITLDDNEEESAVSFRTDKMTRTNESVSEALESTGSSQCNSSDLDTTNISLPLNEHSPETFRRRRCQNVTMTEGNLAHPHQSLFRCTVPQEYQKISEISNYIDSILTFIIPFLIIFCLNLKIIFCIKRFKGHRESLVANIKISHRTRQSQCCSRYSSVVEIPKLKDVLTTNGKQNQRLSIRNFKIKRSKSCCKCREIEGSLRFRNRTSSRKSGSLKNRRKSRKTDCFLDMEKGSVESDGGSTGSSGGGQITPPPKRMLTNHSTTAMEVRITKTLLLVSSVFLLLHFPSHSIRVASFIQSFGGSAETRKNLFVAQMWSNILFNTNFAVNFLLYCCSGKAFRHSVRHMLSWKRPYSSPLRTNTTTVMTAQFHLNNTELLGGGGTGGTINKVGCRQDACTVLRDPAEDQV